MLTLRAHIKELKTSFIVVVKLDDSLFTIQESSYKILYTKNTQYRLIGNSLFPSRSNAGLDDVRTNNYCKKIINELTEQFYVVDWREYIHFIDEFQF